MNKSRIFDIFAIPALIFAILVVPVALNAHTDSADHEHNVKYENHEQYHNGENDYAYWEKHKGHDHKYEEWCPYDEEHPDEYIWPSLECTVSNANPKRGDVVTYTATPRNGEGPFTYRWVGDFAGTNQTEQVKYVTNGRYSVIVETTDKRGNSTYDNCPLVVVDEAYHNPLSVSCSVSDTTVEEDDRVRFTANPQGGTGTYTYRWYGDFTGSRKVEDISFHSEGTKRAYLEVTDSNGAKANTSCDSVRVEEENDDFEVSCKVSDTSVKEGERVIYTAEVEGGDSPYTYEWDGDIEGDNRRESVEFNRDGTYEVEITVKDDDGNRVTDTCPDVHVSDDTVATAATVDSVYLSQVPYTGPEDTFKVIGYILLILSASILSVYAIARKKLSSEHSSRIDMFKQANKNATEIN